MHKKIYHCLECGHDGPLKNTVRGSFIIEIGLYILSIILGLIFAPLFLLLVIAIGYSVWRLSSQRKVCEICSSPKVIPMDKWEILKKEKEEKERSN